MTLIGDNLSFCYSKLFGVNQVSFDISSRIVVYSGVQIDYELNQIDTFNHFIINDSLYFGQNVAYVGKRAQVIENSCENQLLFLNKNNITLKNGEDLSIKRANYLIRYLTKFGLKGDEFIIKIKEDDNSFMKLGVVE